MVLPWSRFRHTDHFHRNGHKLCIFFRKLANSLFATKSTKEKRVSTLILPQRLASYRAKEDEYSPSEFYYPEELETSNVETETGISKSQEAIDDFINKQKVQNDRNNLFRV